MAEEAKPQAGEPEIETTTDEGQAPESTAATLPEETDSRVKKANREAATYRTKLRAVEDELAKLKKAEEDRKSKDMTETEKAKKDAEDARAEAIAAKAAAESARAEAIVARSGVLEKYVPVMTSALIAAKTEDPSLDVAEWSKTYKESNAELFGVAKHAAATGAGGPPPPKTGERQAKLQELEKELERWSSGVNYTRPDAGIRRVALTKEINKLRSQMT